MGAELPPYLGWVVGGFILALATIAFGTLVVLSLRDLRRSDPHQPSPWRPKQAAQDDAAASPSPEAPPVQE